MATTPNQAFPYPTKDDQPDPPADIRALAEALDANITASAAAVASLTDRVAALEDGTGGSGWVVIDSGSAPAGHSFTIDLTADGKFPSPPAWNQIQVLMRLDMTAPDLVLCRVNGDSDSVYRSGGAQINSTGTVEEPWHYAGNNTWAIGRTATTGTNSCTFTMYASDFNPGLMTFQSTMTRESDTDTAHEYGVAHGSLTAGKTVTSLEFLGNTTTDFVNCWWTAMGLRLEHPS